MTILDLSAIEARANAATEGPWESVPGDNGHLVSGLQEDGEYDWNIALIHGPFAHDGRGLFDGTVNRDFICHARTDIPALLSRVKELEARLVAILDWADIALKNREEFDSHGVRNLTGPVFDEARTTLAPKGE